MMKVVALLFCLCAFAFGDFYKVQLRDLDYAEGGEELLAGTFLERDWNSGWESRMPIPRFGEFAFVVSDLALSGERVAGRTNGDAWLILELEKPMALSGFVDFWAGEGKGFEGVACEIEDGVLKKCEGEELAAVRKRSAGHRLETGARGGLWYRSQHGGSTGRDRDQDFNETFTTLSGGRALAENLALDREMILGQNDDEEKVDLASIKGVTVKPIPWAEKMPEGEIVVDALSKRVPEDQYFMVVPSLRDLFALMDRVEEAGTPVLQSFSVGDDYRELPSRYRRQMGLDLPDALSRFLPIKSVAVTGGDPFFPTGSDLAVIFETEKVDFVYGAIRKVVEAKASLAGATEKGEGFENATRSFSSYLMKLDGAVVVANSPVQLTRLRAVVEEKSHALGESDEYRFFRHRYPIGADESAYVFISDACLRHWAGPKVRIAASRRSRALAGLAKETSGVIAGRGVSQEFAPMLGEVTAIEGRVVSEKYGSLGFLTPISELEIEKVSAMEQQGYERWRRGYEGGWAKFFDPIAIRLNLGKNREEIEMTILPLRVDSYYQEIISLVGNAMLSKAAADSPSEALFHFAMALDRESEIFKSAGVSILNFIPGLKINPLGWMGESVSVSLGESLVWKSGFASEEALRDLPVLARIEVDGRIKLALFMTSLKGALEISSPDLVSWETRKHEGRKYVAVVGDPDELGADVSLYYATLPTALLVSLNEDMLKRAIEREAKLPRRDKSEDQVLAKASTDLLTGFGERSGGVSFEERRRRLSWAALPILNEWYLRKAAQDPVGYHEGRFARKLSCPGGGGYRWNAEDLTMESVAYGHPGKPRSEAKVGKMLGEFQTMEMAASFEDDGLRIAVALDESACFEPVPLGGAPRPEGDDEVVSLSEIQPLKEGMVQRFRIETLVEGEGEKTTETSEFRVGKVTREGEVTLIEESYRILTGEDKWSQLSKYEMSPKGLRLLAMENNEKMTFDEEVYEMPAELWPGQIFRVKSMEGLMEDGGKYSYLVEEIVKVVGWEEFPGPDGETLKVLRVEKNSTSLMNGNLDHFTTIEWHAKDLGMVKVEVKSRGYQSTTILTEVIMPGKE